MSANENMDAWAQLVCTTDTETPPIEVNRDKFTIGRARDNDLALTDNKLVSGHHCYLEKDGAGKVWLYDTSTNGTLLNMTQKLTKGECRQLQHGDEFFIVHKKNNEEMNTGYMYQDLEELAREEDSDPDPDQTQEYDDLPAADSTLVDDELNLVPTPKKRPCPPDSEKSSAEPAVKKQKSEDTIPSESAESKQRSSTGEDLKAGDTCDLDKKPEVKTEDVSEQKECLEESKQSEEKKKEEKKMEDESDAMAETLVCIICQEILHDCISLQPCMHSFCSGCYSDWMERSNECPSCRLKVDRINKNHIVNNLVEAYLKEHPERKRPEEDIKELDAKNKITRDMLYPKKKRRSSYDDASSEAYTDSEEDEPPPPIVSTTVFTAPPAGGQLFGFGTPFFGQVRPAKTVCRQCAEYKDPNTTGTGIVGGITTALNTVKNLVTGAGPGNDGATPGPAAGGDNPGTSTDGAGGASTSGDGDQAPADPDQKVMPAPPAYTCAVNQNHVLCQCCVQPMPDRRHERVNNPAIPPQQCLVCYRAYCHAYWGCRNVNCNGCIGRFRDLNFGKKCLPNLILDNASESTIFKDYLEDNNISVKDVLKTCLTKMAAGQYKCPDQARYLVNGDTVFCYTCGMRNFRELAYQYRKDIPRDQLPEAVRKRPDCYWGKNCRTQRNKPHHAANFNHICDQTRTT